MQQYVSLYDIIYSPPPPPNLLVEGKRLLGVGGLVEEEGVHAWGGGEIGKFMKQKKNPKSTLLADNTRGLKPTKQAQASRFCSELNHPPP